MSNEERIEFFSQEIDSTIGDLDVKLDQVLEKHEQDFLKAYKFQILKVQEELAEATCGGYAPRWYMCVGSGPYGYSRSHGTDPRHSPPGPWI